MNITAFPNGSSLTNWLRQVGLALGIASLTVNEQTTMLSTLADNGVYHQSHIVKYWQLTDGAEQMPKVESHGVLDPSNPTNNAQLDAQVQYAMEMTTVDGTAYLRAPTGSATRQVIGKTGTTTNSHAGLLHRRDPQYSLVVGMFTSRRTPTRRRTCASWPAAVSVVTGRRRSGTRSPRRSSRTCRQRASTNPVFTGSGVEPGRQAAQAEARLHRDGPRPEGLHPRQGLPEPDAERRTATTGHRSGNQTCNGNNRQCQNQNDPNGNGQNPTPTPTCQNQNDPNCNGQNPTPTSTCDPNDPTCSGQNPTPTLDL